MAQKLRGLPLAILLTLGLFGTSPLAHRVAAEEPAGPKAEEPAKRTDVDAAVTAGLKWIARQQLSDGYWALKSPPDNVPGTGLALLALLRGGETHQAREHPHAKNVDKGLRWLLAQQAKDGSFEGGKGYHHGIATLALCEALARTGDATIKPAAQKAVDFIVQAQGPDGGWRYLPKQAGDTSVTGWMAQALKKGEQAGLHVPKETWTNLSKYLDGVAAPTGGFGYVRPPASPGPTAAGCLCRFYLGTPVKDDHFAKSLAMLHAQPPSAKYRNIYYHYYASQVMNHLEPATRDRWNRDMAQVLLDRQTVGGGDQVGSWPQTGDAFASHAGPLMTTTLAVCILELRHPPDLALRPLPARELKAGEVESLWNGLKGESVFQATQNIRVLAAAPGQTVPFLRKCLQPVRAPDPGQLAQHIADLDSNSFTQREKAREELEKLGELAVPALEKVLAAKPGLDLRRRVESLLARVEREPLSAEQVQALRALRILERIDHPEARRILREMAGGAPGATTTREAAAALARLSKKSEAAATEKGQ